MPSPAILGADDEHNEEGDERDDEHNDEEESARGTPGQEVKEKGGEVRKTRISNGCVCVAFSTIAQQYTFIISVKKGIPIFNPKSTLHARAKTVQS